MVYCGLYPADGAKYPDLRDALEKLQLNDAALQFEAGNIGRTWDLDSAVDFSDLLHLEIIQERLEREYNLDLVTTAPGVIYKVHKDKRRSHRSDQSDPIFRIRRRLNIWKNLW